MRQKIHESASFLSRGAKGVFVVPVFYNYNFLLIIMEIPFIQTHSWAGMVSERDSKIHASSSSQTIDTTRCGQTHGGREL